LGVAVSPDGQFGLSAGEDGSLRLWKLDTGREVRNFGEDKRERLLFFAAFSPDGRLVISGGDDSNITIWETETGNEVGRLSHGSRMITAVFSPEM
jgi:WD40 repeat protein